MATAPTAPPQTGVASPPTGTEPKTATGRIVQVQGPVVDVSFPPDQLPAINNAISLKDPFGESVLFEDSAFVQAFLASARAAVARLGSVSAYYSIQVATAWSNFATTGLFGFAVRNAGGLVDKVHNGLVQTILYGGKDGAYGLYYSLLRGLNTINKIEGPYYSGGRWTIEITYARQFCGLFGSIKGEVIRFYE
jgi:hypothetical protein